MPETFGSGAGFIDFDGDGWPDILLVSGGVWPGHGDPIPALQVYRNNRDGSFTRVTDEVGLGNVSAYGFGIAAADYDNDGDQDIFLSTLGRNLLLRNDPIAEQEPQRTFTEVGERAGIGDESSWSTAALFFDADRDGWVDLFVGNYVPWSRETDKWCTSDGNTKDYCTPHQYEGSPGRFYRNNGDGTFTDQTTEAGFGHNPGKTLGITELDADQDGWPDLVVANDTERNLFYLNDGDGTFSEIGLETGLAYGPDGRARAGMGIDAGIVDAGGQPTVFVGNFTDEPVSVFRRTAGGGFVDRSAASGIGIPSILILTFGLLLTDFELDGDLDLVLANGHIVEHVEQLQETVTYRQPPHLYINSGAGRFELGKQLLEHRLVGRGLASADYDRDGDIDLLLTENGGPLHLLRNELRPNASANFLRVRLDGRRSSRDALGARIIAVAGGIRQERRVRTGGSYLSQSELAVTFGLGAATAVDSVVIEWPSGEVDRMLDVRANQELRIIEGSPDASLDEPVFSTVGL